MQVVYQDSMREVIGLPTSRQNAVSLIGGCVTREKIMRLENALIEMLKAQGKDFTVGNTDEDAPLTHHFAPGLYAREIFLPKGLIIIGKIHRHAHVNTISKGHVIVATEFGTEELKAPHSWASQPGIKRAVVALEDTIWTTYHPTDETNLVKIEEHVIAPSFEAYDMELLK
jgi:hypothetical protein